MFAGLNEIEWSRHTCFNNSHRKSLLHIGHLFLILLKILIHDI